MRLIIIGLSLILLQGCVTLPGGGPLPSQSWPVQECGWVPDQVGIQYCYYESGANPQGDPILFAHGLGDGQDVFRHPTLLPSNYPDLIAELSKKPRKILTVSWGISWEVTDYPNRTINPSNATMTNFAKVLKTLEAKYNLSGRYNAMGHSMGGFNLAGLLAKYPEKWKSVTLINPMLVVDSIHIWDDIRNSINNQKFTVNCAGCVVDTFNFPFLDDATWAAYRPSTMLINSKGPYPPLFITACKTDEFKLYDGAKEYADQARTKGLSVTWLEGADGCSHTKFDSKAIVDSAAE